MLSFFFVLLDRLLTGCKMNCSKIKNWNMNWIKGHFLVKCLFWGYKQIIWFN